MDPESASNLPASGRDSGKGLEMVKLANTDSWCEPIAVPCKQPSREYVRTNRIEQRTRMGPVGSMGLSRTVPRRLARTVWQHPG